MKHRKLFPSPTTANETLDCTGFCDPACPNNCYAYPDYTFPPPSPPERPPSGQVKDHLSIILIIMVIVLSGFFLLVSYHMVISKFCLGWRNNRPRRFQAQSVGRDDEEFLDQNRIDHHIWFITTAGIQQSVINSIAICRYKKGEGLIEGTECSICLSEFREDEMLRLLPKCSHAFHIRCVDTWLRSHTNCPLCRARIIAESVDFGSGSIEQNLDSLGLLVDTQMDISQTGGEQHPELGQNWEGTEEGLEIQPIGSERTLKENDNSLVPDYYKMVKNDVQRFRRSISLGHLSVAGVANFSPVEEVGNSVQSLPNSGHNRHRLRRWLSCDGVFLY